jgi:ABC-2 type transport system permease protein
MRMLAGRYFLKNIQQFLSDKSNFWMYFATIFLHQAIFVVFISVLFSHIPDIKGWSFYEILFMYGFYQIVSGAFYSVFSWTLWFPSAYVMHRKLDQILISPASPYYLITCEEFGKSVMEFITVALGIGVMIYACLHLDLHFTFSMLIQLIILLVSGCLILGGVFTAITASAFWLKSEISLASLFMELMDFAQYPATIYPRWLRFALTYIFPIAFVSFYPASTVLRPSEGAWLAVASIGVGIVSFCGGLGIWQLGLRRYESSGN